MSSGLEKVRILQKKALNFARIAVLGPVVRNAQFCFGPSVNVLSRGGIILFVCRQPPLIHMVDRFEFDFAPFLVEM